MTISAPSSSSGYCAGVMSGSRWMWTSGSPGFASRSKITASDSLASTKTPRTGFSIVRTRRRRSLRRDAGDRQHGVHQGIGAGGAVRLRGVLEFVVADAVLAGNEDHRRRHHIGEVAGVVTGAGSDAAVAVAERLGGVLDGVDQFGIEHGGRFAPDRIEGDLGLASWSDLGDRAAQIAIDGLERFGAGAADIDGEGDLAGNDVTRRRGNDRLADGADCVRTMHLRNPLHRQNDFRQCRQRVATQRHRRGAGVALETGDLAVIPDDALAAIDHADGLVLGLQQRPLFDVQFDEGAEFAVADRLVAAIADTVERLADADAGGILAAENVV